MVECHGRNASDVFIIWNSGFLDILDPKDQVMTERGFKIKTDLAMRQRSPSFPTSAAKRNQIAASEQGIKITKEFHVLKQSSQFFSYQFFMVL